jgi:hypothetical protein
MISGKNLYFGYYETLEEAKQVWKEAAAKHYGQFAE